MKTYWTIFKAIAALVIAIVIIVWAVTSTRPIAYSGANLTFAIGTGAITVTNPSNQAIPAQFLGQGTRTFTVASNIDGVAGTSTKQTVGTVNSQLFGFTLPAGTSEFTVIRGTKINFEAPNSVNLTASVLPIDESQVRTTMIVAAVVVAAMLWYVSHLYEHRWIDALRGKSASPVTQPTVRVVSDGGQGQGPRSYGDNRSDKTE